MCAAKLGFYVMLQERLTKFRKLRKSSAILLFLIAIYFNLNLMKLLSIVFFLTLVQGAFAQIKTTKLTKQEIPKSIQYLGHIVNAAKYSDNEGEHLVITTETSKDVVIGGDSSYTKDDIYAYNYIIKGDQQTLLWQMHDFSMVCPVDTKAKYIPNTFSVTDLNKDGKAEVWLMYIIACRGDVSPGAMKIIMHEGAKKYAIRGSSRVESVPKKYDGGDYKMDETFKDGPEAFRKFALELWKKNMNENGD